VLELISHVKDKSKRKIVVACGIQQRERKIRRRERESMKESFYDFDYQGIQQGILQSSGLTLP